MYEKLDYELNTNECFAKSFDDIYSFLLSRNEISPINIYGNTYDTLENKKIEPNKSNKFSTGKKKNTKPTKNRNKKN